MEALLLQYGYLILFPISFLEGQVSTLICGFLVSIGYFNPLIVLFIIVLADLTNDAMYYRIGRKFLHSKRIYNRIDKSHFISRHLGTMEKLWLNHPMKTMILGKNTYIISIAVIASAGMVKWPYRRFLLYSIPASFIQPIILLTVGYYLGNGYALASAYLAYPGIIIAIVCICILFFYRQAGKYLANKFDTFVNK